MDLMDKFLLGWVFGCLLLITLINTYEIKSIKEMTSVSCECN